MTTTVGDPPWRVRLRRAAFLLVLAFEALGPAYRQVLHGRNPLFRNWVMYRGMGYGVVDVTFRRRLPDDTEVEVDRFGVLGYDRPRAAPTTVWRIEGMDGTRAVAAELCRVLGPGTDLRAYAHMASATGWTPILAGEDDLCAAPPVATRRRAHPAPGHPHAAVLSTGTEDAAP
jgi:hypothetical protein